MKLKFQTKGRPLTIDVEKELSKFQQYLPKAKERLEQFRRDTSGYRSEKTLGTSTTLPDFIESSLVALEMSQHGESFSLKEAREIKSTIKTLKQLTSKQERVFGRALEPILTREYLEDISYMKKNASRYAEKQLTKLEKNIKKLTARQRQKLFFSKGYQDIKTIYVEYEHIRSWAEKKSRKKDMSYQEAGFYLIAKRQKQGLDTLGLEEHFS